MINCYKILGYCSFCVCHSAILKCFTQFFHGLSLKLKPLDSLSFTHKTFQAFQRNSRSAIK